jgi:hypothetical protein
MVWYVGVICAHKYVIIVSVPVGKADIGEEVTKDLSNKDQLKETALIKTGATLGLFVPDYVTPNTLSSL